jgi:hypothetical protein
LNIPNRAERFFGFLAALSHGVYAVVRFEIVSDAVYGVSKRETRILLILLVPSTRFELVTYRV